MKYELQVTPSFERSFKKLPSSVRTFVKQQVFGLEVNPLLGKPLKNQFRLFRSLHLKLNNISYRVVYTVNDSKQVIDLHYVATRENFYSELRRLRFSKSA